MMFKTVLVANRGEIAVRAIRTLKKLGIQSVAIYAESDRFAQHVEDADLSISLHGEKPADTYLNMTKIIEIAKQTGAEAIFPGYGFLSESAEFAQLCEDNKIAFMGPTPQQILDFGLKHRARELAGQAGVPMTPGTALLTSLDDALVNAQNIGYPIMLKSTAGGGGIGLTRCDDEQALKTAYESVKRLGEQFFKDAGVFLEKFVDQARHIEVQIFGDGCGEVIALGERDCSLQRRNQKVIEETPAPHLFEATRQQLHAAAIQLGQSVLYRSVGTVEFIYDVAHDKFYFLEVNTRLQVEHPVTEMVTGLDLIECMLKVSAQVPLNWKELKQIEPNGVAIEARIYAENPVANFQPSPGVLTDVYFPKGVRVDTWVKTGTEVSQFFDPMIAKMIVHAPSRDLAIQQMNTVLEQTHLNGISTNLDYIRHIVADERFKTVNISTRMLDHFEYAPCAVEFLTSGTLSSVQDYPGRLGYWHIGVPPSGPMDDYAFRLANKIVGNALGEAAFEFTLQGPNLKFHTDTVIVLTGAQCEVTLDDVTIPLWQAITVKAGQVLNIGQVQTGCRIYLAIQGGLDVPEYMGSRSTFALGQFGGYAGRTLRAGDVVPINKKSHIEQPIFFPQTLIPTYGKTWKIGVMYGPHGAPDFFASEYIDEFFKATWTVHFNSNRLGIRLVGPKPVWARENGGEAGLHPSNVHDCEYAIGAINFTGDFPVIIGKDGPSLGGFVCPVTVVKAELWKLGQLKADDQIQFYPMSVEQANTLEKQQNAKIENLHTIDQQDLDSRLGQSILYAKEATKISPTTVYRQAGDCYILLEYGDDVLDIGLRLRVDQLMQRLEKNKISGVLELSPGVRSLQIKYDSLILPQKDLVDRLIQLEHDMGDLSNLKIPSRIIHLPMAFEDTSTLNAVKRYQESVCSQAPWLSNNVDFIQRINGLKNREDVKNIIFDANYLVLGLGDVYLTAPCAVPIDPRHRLLSSKYNPARTFTPEGTVGIGGMYMCIYGMDSPGGYQLVGRTVPIWDKFIQNPQFENKPWFLRFFDQIKFYEVTEDELNTFRADFAHGLARIKIEETVFDFAEYTKFLEQNIQSIEDLKENQQQAFTQEVTAWKQTAQVTDEHVLQTNQEDYTQYTAILAPMTGNVWKLLVDAGQTVEQGQTVAIIEAMKMELPVVAQKAGTVHAVVTQVGKTVFSGDAMLYLDG